MEPEETFRDLPSELWMQLAGRGEGSVQNRRYGAVLETTNTLSLYARRATTRPTVAHCGGGFGKPFLGMGRHFRPLLGQDQPSGGAPSRLSA